MSKYIIIVLGVCVIVSYPVAAQNPSVKELLDKYAATQDKFQSFILKSETSRKYNYTAIKTIVEPRDITEFRYDGDRCFVKMLHWGIPSIGSKEFIPKEKAGWVIYLWDGKWWLSYTGGEIKGAEYYNVMINRTSEGYKSMITSLDYGSFLRGFFHGGTKGRIDSILRQENSVFVRTGMEEIGESDCYVIEADTKHGKYTFWIDPSHGYYIAKAEIKRNEIQYYNNRNGAVQKDVRQSYSLKDVRFKKVQDVWIPVEGHVEQSTYSPRGDALIELHHVVTDITLNPDHDSLGSFELDFIRNGALVGVAGVKGKYRWQDGKVVDSYGHEVNLETLKPPSLVGKALPGLTKFNLRLNPKLVENKMVLVCFWDMNQRPSRNCVQNLNKRAQTLLNRNVFMVFVHAGPVAEQKLIAWLKNNKIEPPVGMSRANLPELGQSWGVQSLPWLILTDKEHIVQAEGFGINGLDEKITMIRKK